jgi:hypothetical protein
MTNGIDKLSDKPDYSVPVHFIAKSLRRLGGRTRARTWDPLIKSQLLYQLSYAPGLGPKKPLREPVV